MRSLACKCSLQLHTFSDVYCAVYSSADVYFCAEFFNVVESVNVVAVVLIACTGGWMHVL